MIPRSIKPIVKLVQLEIYEGQQVILPSYHI